MTLTVSTCPFHAKHGPRAPHYCHYLGRSDETDLGCNNPPHAGRGGGPSGPGRARSCHSMLSLAGAQALFVRKGKGPVGPGIGGVRGSRYNRQPRHARHAGLSRQPRQSIAYTNFKLLRMPSTLRSTANLRSEKRPVGAGTSGQAPAQCGCGADIAIHS